MGYLIQGGERVRRAYRAAVHGPPIAGKLIMTGSRISPITNTNAGVCVGKFASANQIGVRRRWNIMGRLWTRFIQLR